MAKKDKTIIGRNVLITFNSMGDVRVPAKVDTGAYRSALHATDIKVIERDGKEILQCKLFGHRHSPDTIDYEADVFTEVVAISSFGDQSRRYAIELPISVEGETFTASFSLADRTRTTFPILFGRRAMNGRFLVNPEQFEVKREELHLHSDENNTDNEEEDE